jgi:hypothetical protein
MTKAALDDRQERLDPLPQSILNLSRLTYSSRVGFPYPLSGSLQRNLTLQHSQLASELILIPVLKGTGCVPTLSAMATTTIPGATSTGTTKAPK